jgi:hypothetical protein
MYQLKDSKLKFLTLNIYYILEDGWRKEKLAPIRNVRIPLNPALIYKVPIENKYLALDLSIESMNISREYKHIWEQLIENKGALLNQTLNGLLEYHSGAASKFNLLQSAFNDSTFILQLKWDCYHLVIENELIKTKLYYLAKEMLQFYKEEYFRGIKEIA